MIGDVEVGIAGDIFVLDLFGNDVGWFDAEGRFKGRVGRQGSGPGEYRSALRMAYDPSGQLHVYDVARRRISTFDVSGGVAMHLRDLRIANTISDMCSLAGHVFAVSPTQSRIVQELDTAGAVVNSFGPPEMPEPAIAREMARAIDHVREFYNTALIACESEPSTIVVVHENIPVVRAFNTDGTLKWRTTLVDFNQREIYSTNSSTGFGVRVRPDLGTAHAASAVAFASSDHLVITLWRGNAEQPEGVLEARIIDVSNGAEVGRFTPPGRLARVLRGTSYMYAQHPYPTVKVFPGTTSLYDDLN